ncbi:hypothetical protein M426DRAFT_257985 [Hypoxylon sp. CI-4A]|nr:hypothetical protein M426DRAFT_257985 [Hypoxylon sp. CI-4A]
MAGAPRYESSDLKVFLILDKLSNTPSIATFARVDDEDEIRRRLLNEPKVLHVAVRVNRTITTLGQIHVYTPGRAVATSDYYSRSPMRDHPYIRPELLLLNLLIHEDACYAASELSENLTSSDVPRKEVEDEKKRLKPVTDYLEEFEARMEKIKEWDVEEVAIALKANDQYVRTKPELRILLIDVEGSRLVKATTASRVFKTKSSNRSSLEIADSLRQAPLPRIFRDSVEFTKRMGERYLWVAALCIEQDSDSP